MLRLDDAGREYLYELSAKDAARPRQRRAQKVRIHFRRLLDDLTEIPALILGRRMDVLAWNPLAAALITDFDAIPERHRNYVRITFTDPAMRTLYPDCDQAARRAPSGTHRGARRRRLDSYGVVFFGIW